VENTTRRRSARSGSETSAPRPARKWAAARPAKQSACTAAAVKALIWVASARMVGPRVERGSRGVVARRRLPQRRAVGVRRGEAALVLLGSIWIRSAAGLDPFCSSWSGITTCTNQNSGKLSVDVRTKILVLFLCTRTISHSSQ
jgi:hypothetical protein